MSSWKKDGKTSTCISLHEERVKKTSSYLWIQSCNLKIPLLAHYTNYLSSFSTLFQPNYLLFPSGLLLFSASLAANELRYRTACLLSLFFPNIYRGARAGGLRRITGGIKLDNIQLDTHRFNCAYRKNFWWKWKLSLFFKTTKIYLFSSSMNLFLYRDVICVVS